MADIIYGEIHKVYGKGSFVEEDYRGYLSDNEAEEFFDGKSKFAGLILYDENTISTIEGFIQMCSDAKPAIIVIEFYNITDKEKAQKYWEYAESLINELGIYYNLQSYETKLAFGLKQIKI